MSFVEMPPDYVIRQVQWLIPAWEWGREIGGGRVEWSGVRSPRVERSMRLAAEDAHARRWKEAGDAATA